MASGKGKNDKSSEDEYFCLIDGDKNTEIKRYLNLDCGQRIDLKTFPIPEKYKGEPLTREEFVEIFLLMFNFMKQWQKTQRDKGNDLDGEFDLFTRDFYESNLLEQFRLFGSKKLPGTEEYMIFYQFKRALTNRQPKIEHFSSLIPCVKKELIKKATNLFIMVRFVAFFMGFEYNGDGDLEFEEKEFNDRIKESSQNVRDFRKWYLKNPFNNSFGFFLAGDQSESFCFYELITLPDDRIFTKWYKRHGDDCFSELKRMINEELAEEFENYKKEKENFVLEEIKSFLKIREILDLIEKIECFFERHL